MQRLRTAYTFSTALNRLHPSLSLLFHPLFSSSVSFFSLLLPLISTKFNRLHPFQPSLAAYSHLTTRMLPAPIFRLPLTIRFRKYNHCPCPTVPTNSSPVTHKSLPKHGTKKTPQKLLQMSSQRLPQRFPTDTAAKIVHSMCPVERVRAALTAYPPEHIPPTRYPFHTASLYCYCFYFPLGPCKSKQQQAFRKINEVRL